MSSFCTACGNSVDADDQFCRVCGKQVSTPPGATIPAAPAPPVGPPETSSKAIVSLVSGLLFFFLPFSIVAIVFGHLSLADIRKSAGRLKGDGLAMAGLVLGYMGLAAIPLLIIAAIAIPNFLRAKMAANESSAVASIRTLNTAEVSYSSSDTEAGFTCSLFSLQRAGLIDSILARGQKSGYRFSLSHCAADTEGGARVKYKVTAEPLTVNTTGIRAFCSDESAVIKVDSGGSAERCLEHGVPLQ